jgi:hypothetical protein
MFQLHSKGSPLAGLFSASTAQGDGNARHNQRRPATTNYRPAERIPFPLIDDQPHNAQPKPRRYGQKYSDPCQGSNKRPSARLYHHHQSKDQNRQQ